MNGVTAYGLFSSLYCYLCPTDMYRLLLERLQVSFVLLDKLSII